MGTVLAFALSSAFVPDTAHAYLDPGTGSAVFQMLLAGVMAGVFVLKSQWQRIKVFFRKTSTDAGAEQDDDAPGEHK